jgi:ketosteroid isomerase-like protein
MDGDVELLKRIYDCFNARDIDGVLPVLADDVAWANGMDGGHVYGREAVRAYWTRQWTGCCLVAKTCLEPERYSGDKGDA